MFHVQEISNEAYVRSSFRRGCSRSFRIRRPDFADFREEGMLHILLYGQVRRLLPGLQRLLPGQLNRRSLLWAGSH